MTDFRWGAATDVGRVRKANQDQLLTAVPMFVVADGMGGHNGGEVASAIAIDEMAKAVQLQSIDDLVEAVQQANREIVDRSKLEPELRGMGTTLVVLSGITNGNDQRLGVANVGDSRVYRRTDDELVQITEDHTLVEALVRNGRLTPEEALNHPQRNIVTRALGIDEKALVDTWELAPVAGDRYLLCSDGLFNELDPDTILGVLHRVDDPADAAVELVSAACDAGGRDNVTVVVVDVVASSTSEVDVADDRVIAVHKAVPDGVVRGDRPLETGPSDPHPDEIVVDRTVSKPPLVTWRLVLFVSAVLLVLAVLLWSILVYARPTYRVGNDGQDVIITRESVLWIDATIEESVDLTVAELDPSDLPEVMDGREFDDLDDARSYVAELTQRAANDEP